MNTSITAANELRLYPRFVAAVFYHILRRSRADSPARRAKINALKEICLSLSVFTVQDVYPAV
jgi:hypothetical protein